MVPPDVVNKFLNERARAEGELFTRFCAERGYVRDVDDFTDEQFAEWAEVYEAQHLAPWRERAANLEAAYATTPDTGVVLGVVSSS